MQKSTKTKPKNILIIDDDAICAKVLGSFLTNMGYSNSIVASTGNDALKLMSTKDFALVFLDLHLSDMSGIDFCHYYKKNCLHKNTPIICCSSSLVFITEKDLAKTCIEAGMDDFLHKPVSAEKLKEIIERWLPKRTFKTS